MPKSQPCLPATPFEEEDNAVVDLNNPIYKELLDLVQELNEFHGWNLKVIQSRSVGFIEQDTKDE